MWDTITVSGTLKKLLTDENFLTDLRRRLKQQNSVRSKCFVWNPDELLNFFCGSDTKLRSVSRIVTVELRTSITFYLQMLWNTSFF